MFCVREGPFKGVTTPYLAPGDPLNPTPPYQSPAHASTTPPVPRSQEGVYLTEDVKHMNLPLPLDDDFVIKGDSCPHRDAIR
jgi:hypothetical protein